MVYLMSVANLKKKVVERKQSIKLSRGHDVKYRDQNFKIIDLWLILFKNRTVWKKKKSLKI